MNGSGMRFRIIFEDSPVGMIIYGPDYRIIEANKALCATLGYAEQEIIGLGIEVITCPEDLEKSRKLLEDSLAGKTGCFHLENRYIKRDGGVLWTRLTAAALEIPGKGIQGIGIIEDITERRSAEEALRKYERIVSATPDHISLLDRNFEYELVNEAYLKAHGKIRDEVIGQTVSGVMGGEVFEKKLRAHLERCLRGEEIRHEDWFDFPAQGRRFMSVTYQPYYASDNCASGVVVSSRDITELKNAGAFIENVLETVEEGFIVIGRDYRVISANNAYLNMVNLPRDGVIGRHCYEISHHVYKPCCENSEDCPSDLTFRNGERHTAVHTHYDIKGDPLFVEIKTYPVKDENGTVGSVIEVINDITEKRRLEDQLRQAQKMEAVGQLAGGIAHDFNNILSAITGYGHILRTKLGSDDPLRVNVEHILDAAERAADVTHSLLAFSRKQIINVRPVSPNEIMDRVAKILSRLIGEDIELRIGRTAGDVNIVADGGQIEQVLMNLATNARDAMPDGGILTIDSEVVKLDDKFVEIHGYGKPGIYDLIAVSDNGTGMDEKTRKRIFEPFFTTKEMGRGTGLGLSIVYGIIKQHNGFINVYSEVDKGTTFKIYLPAVMVKDVEKPGALRTQSSPARGSETIIVAEDDAALRKLSTVVLTEFGYKVIEAADGEEAVEECIRNSDVVDMVMLDVIMPKKNGREAYEEIKKIKPGIKVLFASGYTADIVHKKGIIDEGQDFLLKPVSPNDLLRKVREILDRKRENA